MPFCFYIHVICHIHEIFYICICSLITTLRNIGIIDPLHFLQFLADVSIICIVTFILALGCIIPYFSPIISLLVSFNIHLTRRHQEFVTFHFFIRPFSLIVHSIHAHDMFMIIILIIIIFCHEHHVIFILFLFFKFP